MNQLSGTPDSRAQDGSKASGSKACLPGVLGPPGRGDTANPVQAHLSTDASIRRGMWTCYPLKLTLNVGQTALGRNFRTIRSFLWGCAGSLLLHGNAGLEYGGYGAGLNYRSP
jgi:hypothetical protein